MIMGGREGEWKRGGMRFGEREREIRGDSGRKRDSGERDDLALSHSVVVRV